MSESYCFDTSAFINPWRRYYPEDLFPSLWQHVDKLIDEGRLVASSEVRHELRQKDDLLWDYMKHRDGLFRAVNEPQQVFVGEIVNTFQSWVNPESTKNSADPFVVSLAKLENLTVVTYELKVPSNNQRVKIPNVCEHFGVPCVNFVQFMRDTGFKG